MRYTGRGTRTGAQKEKNGHRKGDVLRGEFENTAECEHRICPVKHFIGYAPTLITAEKDNKSAAESLPVLTEKKLKTE